jgi:hypothetical protein
MEPPRRVQRIQTVVEQTEVSLRLLPDISSHKEHQCSQRVRQMLRRNKCYAEHCADLSLVAAVMFAARIV